jgi:hypothetical protein
MYRGEGVCEFQITYNCKYYERLQSHEYKLPSFCIYIDTYFVSINTKGNLQKPSQRHFSGLSTTSLAGKEREEVEAKRIFPLEEQSILVRKLKRKAKQKYNSCCKGFSK